jgi:hypothetical protein
MASLLAANSVEAAGRERVEGNRVNGHGVFPHRSAAWHADHTSYRYHHRPSDSWHPRYNFYRHHYHLYPYIYTTPVVTVSSAETPVMMNGNTYYYDQGTFYQNGDTGRFITPPPIGAVVTTLPPGAVQVVINDTNFYTYNGIYYKPLPQGYEVVEQPH